MSGFNVFLTLFLCVMAGSLMYLGWQLVGALHEARDARHEALKLKREAAENRDDTAEVLAAARASVYAPLVIGDEKERLPTDDTVCTVCEHKLGFHSESGFAGRFCHYPSCACQVSVRRNSREVGL